MPIKHTSWYPKISVTYFDWGDAKNAKLRAERGIGFEDAVFHIERRDLLDILGRPNPSRYAGQRIVVVRRENYVYSVPFVEDEHTIFLKTIIPRRRRRSSTTVYLESRAACRRRISSNGRTSPPKFRSHFELRNRETISLTILPGRNGDHHTKQKDEEWDHRRLNTEW